MKIPTEIPKNWEIRACKNARIFLRHADVINMVRHLLTYNGVPSKETLNKHSFEELKYTWGSASVFVHRKLKLIVKLDGGGMWHSTESFPKKAIPTVIVNDRIRIQPMANVAPWAIALAYRHVCNWENLQCKHDLNLVGDDVHDGNVAIYKHKVVVIDW